MSDNAPPPLTLLPFNDPPSMDKAVKEHLDLIHELHEMRESQRILNENHQRIAAAVTVDRLTLGRLERLVGLVGRDLGLLMNHLGVKRV